MMNNFLFCHFDVAPEDYEQAVNDNTRIWVERNGKYIRKEWVPECS